MKILSLKLENHPVLGNLELDFADPEWNPVDTIIIWWENGTGKSTILDIIHNLWSRYYNLNLTKDERIIFWLLLSENELKLFHNNWLLSTSMWDTKIYITFSLDNTNNVEYKLSVNSPSNSIDDRYRLFHTSYEIYKIFNSIYSDVGINYNSWQKTTITSKILDNNIEEPIKSPNNLADEIAQLLIDIDVQDAQDFQNYSIKHWTYNPDELRKRMRRFENAFNFMFENKKFNEIRTTSNWKEVIFEENWKECNINQLSSWEKQIVFRWSFLLQNQNSINGNVVLIDEPEISLHPNWQLKILDFYKDIFKDSWKQTSQIFVVTHSPFIMHNPNRLNDKVITLSKKEDWNIVVDENPQFFGYTDIEEFVKWSFNVWSLKSDKKVVILSEWKNYNYLEKAKEYFWYDLDVDIKKIDSFGSDEMRSLFENLVKTWFIQSKIFFIWDCDFCNKFQKIKTMKTEYIIPMIFPKNENSKIKWWIENMFNIEDYPENFENEYYSQDIKSENNDWWQTIKIELDKRKFEEYFINNATEDKFINFKQLFEDIKKEIEEK